MITKEKRLATIGLILALGVGQTAFAAQLYTDVPEKFWAEKTILTVTERDIMPGYSDATFKPSQNISKLEGVTVLYRAFKKAGLITETEVQKALETHKTTLADNKIPLLMSPYGSDAQAATAFALDKGIITKDELRIYMNAGKPTDARKLELSIIAGKMLNLFIKEDVNKFFILEFSDSDDISQSSAPYVNLLIEKGIIAAKGDAYGNFNPGSTVNRAVLATMAANLSDYAAKNIKGATGTATGTSGTTGTTGTAGNTTGTTGTTGTPVGTTSTGTTVNRGEYGNNVVLGELIPYNEAAQTSVGQIIATVDKNNVTTKSLTVKDGTGKLFVFGYDGATAEAEGKAIDPKYLKSGQEILATYGGTTIQKIVINQKIKRINGFIGDIKETADVNGTKTRILNVTTAAGGSYNLKLSGAVQPLLLNKDFNAAAADKLITSDYVSLWVEGTDIKAVDAFSRNAVTSVSLMAQTTFKAGSQLLIQLDGGKQIPWLLEKDLNVIKSDRTLTKGDLLKLTLEYGNVTRVESAGVKAMDSGKIKQITIGAKSSVILSSIDGREYTYNLSNAFKLVKGNLAYKEPAYGLRIGQDVTVTNGADGVVKIELGAVLPVDNQAAGYVVKEVIPSANLLRVTDGSQKDWLVVTKASVKLDFSGYKVGDKLDVKGVRIADGVLEAESISLK